MARIPQNFSRACSLLHTFNQMSHDAWEDLDAIDDSGECGPFVAQRLKRSAVYRIRLIKGMTKLSWPAFKKAVVRATSEKYLHRTGLIDQIEQAAAYTRRPGW